MIYYQSYNIKKAQNEDEIYKIEKSTPYQKREYNNSLAKYYERKIQSIHILILFLEKVLKSGYDKARIMMIEYFSNAYEVFLKKYFNETQRNLIKIPLTQEKYEKILYDLDKSQKKIFDDKESESILVLAGPGSGKTKTLVHKIAHLIMIEHRKPQYFLMLAHSRAAVAEFKERIKSLVGSEIYSMQIFTFHAFALHLLGERATSDDDLKNILQKATESLNDSKIELPFIEMLVIDEYQDVGEKSYAFIKAIYSKMPKGSRKIIAVGDDDQCIKNFGEDVAKIEIMQRFELDFSHKDAQDIESSGIFNKYFLLTNYRSNAKIINLANDFRQKYIPQTYKLKKGNLTAHKNIKGIISATFYKDSHFIKNMAKCLQDEMQNTAISTIALLFRTNDEVLLAYSLLLDFGIKARYLLDRDGFSMENLVELRDFATLLEKMNIQNAIARFDKSYKKSKDYTLTKRVIAKFKSEYNEYLQRKDIAIYFMEFLREISFEEFYDTQSRVIVSTMHKVKGKEFDSVYIGVNDKFFQNDDIEYSTRLLYVALTRAKANLHIHTGDQKLFDFLKPYSTHCTYTGRDSTQRRICFIMSLKDIKLANDYAQKGIDLSKPLSGEKCKIKQDSNFYNIYKDSHIIATLSTAFADKISAKMQCGYELECEAEIEHICYWSDRKSKDSNRAYKEVLCKIYMINGR